MKAIKQIATICFTLSLVACTASPVQKVQQSDVGESVVGEEQGEFEAVHAAAKQSLKRAAAANYQWRDSGKILKKAEKTAAKGDYEKATQLAKQAGVQGELAVAQSKKEANAWPRFARINTEIAAAESGIAAAEVARKGANKVGHEWRDTGKILKKAKQAAKQMHFAKAAKLAGKARRQGELAQAQALAQKNAGPRF